MVGVTSAIPLVANIAANLIAFYAFITLISSVFNWSCTLAGAEDGICTLEVSCSMAFKKYDLYIFSYSLNMDFTYAIKLLPSKYIQSPLM